MLREIFGSKFPFRAKSVPAASYEEQRALVQDASDKVRHNLAAEPETRPEVLYYLAQDETADIRRAIAANPATPRQADALLATDTDTEVRADLARKIGRLIPDLADNERDHMRDLALDILETLAVDQLPRIRAIVSEEIKESRLVPAALVKRLALDAEVIVSAPVLEYSPLLSDADLREIVAAATASEALQAIARRAELSAEVSDHVVATFDAAAVATLLANESAQIREETLDQIIDSAIEVESWHEPLVMRPELSIRAMRRIAGFVAASLIDTLLQRHDLDDVFRHELKQKVQERIRDSAGDEEEKKAIEKTASQLEAAGALDDDAIQAAIDAGQREFVTRTLALKSDLVDVTVERILKSGQAKSVTALSWKAGFSMRTAIMLQTHIARIPPTKLLHARNGTDYPLSVDEMAWQIEAMS